MVALGVDHDNRQANRMSLSHLSTLLPVTVAVDPLDAVLALEEAGARPALDTGELEVTADIREVEEDEIREAEEDESGTLRFRGIVQRNLHRYRGQNLAHYTIIRQKSCLK